MDYKQAISFDQLASISELGDPRSIGRCSRGQLSVPLTSSFVKTKAFIALAPQTH